MKNATYVDQSDTIRTLTEEEVAVVSGGMSLAAQQAQARINAAAHRFATSKISDYDPRRIAGSNRLPSWVYARNAYALSTLFG